LFQAKAEFTPVKTTDVECVSTEVEDNATLKQGARGLCDIIGKGII
jgi:hypothetical protein